MSLALYPGRCQKRLGTWNGVRSFQLQSWDLETVALMSLSSDPHKSRKGVGERSKRWYAKLPAPVQSRRPGGKGGGSAGLCELRVRVNYILQWGPLLPSRKAGKRLGRPVRLPHSAEGCLDPGGCLHGARNPESHTWVLLPLRYQPGGHAGDTLALLQVISRKGRSRSQDKTSALQPPPPPPKPVWDGFQVRYPSLREGTFRIPNGCRKG